MAPSLRVTPMPPRISRNSTRPRASDRPMVDTVQPHGLIFVSKLIGVVATNEDAAAEMEYPGARHHTSIFYGERGAGCREPNPRLHRSEQTVLDNHLI